MAGGPPMTDYEKQRLARIRENEARLEALGLRSLAASPLLRNPSPSAAAKRKQKRRSADEDEEYVPYDEGGSEDEEEGTRSRAKGKKIKLLNSSKSSKSATRKMGSSFSDVVDDDSALQQAIALSLAGSCEKSVTKTGGASSSIGMEESEGTPHKKNSKATIQESAKNQRIKKMGKSRIQLTEDDVVAFFFSFDEVGKGYITPWDLERMATINDFIWTDFEISNMIRFFDSDGDGKEDIVDLSLWQWLFEDEEEENRELLLLFGMHPTIFTSRNPMLRSSESPHDFFVRNASHYGQCRTLFRMSPEMFQELHDMLVGAYGLEGTSRSSSVEALGMFLWMVGTPQSNRSTHSIIGRSLDTVHRNYAKVLRCLVQVASDIIKPKDPEFRTIHSRLQHP